MDRRLLFEDDTGYLRIIVPNEKFQQPKESDSESLARLAAGFLPDVVDFLVCKTNKVPTDLIFRDAWRKGDASEPIKFDLKKCLEIHRLRLKEACALKIDQLEQGILEAKKAQNLPLQVALKRTIQILRTLHDMNLTHCKTPEDVKYSIPRELHDVWHWYAPTRGSDSR